MRYYNWSPIDLLNFGSGFRITVIFEIPTFSETEIEYNRRSWPPTVAHNVNHNSNANPCNYHLGPRIIPICVYWDAGLILGFEPQQMPGRMVLFDWKVGVVVRTRPPQVAKVTLNVRTWTWTRVSGIKCWVRSCVRVSMLPYFLFACTFPYITNFFVISNNWHICHTLSTLTHTILTSWKQIASLNPSGLENHIPWTETPRKIIIRM